MEIIKIEKVLSSIKYTLIQVFKLINDLQLTYDKKGLEAILFTADGDMRQAINNLQSTHVGFNDISAENVFKVIKTY